MLRCFIITGVFRGVVWGCCLTSFSARLVGSMFMNVYFTLCLLLIWVGWLWCCVADASV